MKNTLVTVVKQTQNIFVDDALNSEEYKQII